MAGRRFIYGGASGVGSNINSVLLQTRKPSSSKPFDSLFHSGSSPFISGSRSMVSFEDVTGVKRSSGSFFQPFDLDENGDEDFDDYFHQPEKKRRLKADQVRFLEKSFDEENKLEPERKVQLAKDLGLQPRQVAIWFQNRRARWKNKQLEKDYDILQDSYNTLKANYESLLDEKEILKAEVVNLTDKLLVREKESSESFSVKSPSEEAPSQEHSTDLVREGEVSKIAMLECQLMDDNAAAKSDLFDSDSPHYTDGSHSPLLERGDSSYVFEPEQSDVSQDEDDSFLPYTFPKVEDANYPSPDPPANTCYFGFPGEDQVYDFWPY